MSSLFNFFLNIFFPCVFFVHCENIGIARYCSLSIDGNSNKSSQKERIKERKDTYRCSALQLNSISCSRSIHHHVLTRIGCWAKKQTHFYHTSFQWQGNMHGVLTYLYNSSLLLCSDVKEFSWNLMLTSVISKKTSWYLLNALWIGQKEYSYIRATFDWSGKNTRCTMYLSKNVDFQKGTLNDKFI